MSEFVFDVVPESLMGQLQAERALADDLADVLTGTTKPWDPEWFAKRDRVLARYREARR